ncbi:MAG TPA: hypothetical protein PKD53_30680 [Chloroflexaceae bacterium]|mgnify:CR=1 FL=1|nr:hypothetical protein [Chloroflexaceae bacterium]
MMPKQRGVVGRTRATPRPGRRPAAASEEARMAEARRVARRFVAARWPELAGVAPVASARRAHAPSAELLARLGLGRGELAEGPAAGEYTFTFAGERPAGEGATTPLVANVIVDAKLRIVKASVSR